MRRGRRIAPARPRLLASLLIAAITCLMLSACHKECHCYGYDGAHTFYSEEQVDENGGTCAEMIYFANIRRYSICEWDY